MSCRSAPCVYEEAPQDHRSTGPVSDAETVYRAGFDPLHYDKKQRVKIALIRGSDLQAGRLSVWRWPHAVFSDMATLINVVRVPHGNTLRALYGAKVEVLRHLAMEGREGRLFCVVDECDTDDAGGHHPAHAHVSPCRQAMLTEGAPSDEVAFALREQLLLAFRAGHVWAVP